MTNKGVGGGGEKSNVTSGQWNTLQASAEIMMVVMVWGYVTMWPDIYIFSFPRQLNVSDDDCLEWVLQWWPGVTRDQTWDCSWGHTLGETAVSWSIVRADHWYSRMCWVETPQCLVQRVWRMYHKHVRRRTCLNILYSKLKIKKWLLHSL